MQKQLNEEQIDECVGIVEEVIDQIDSAMYELTKLMKILDTSGQRTLSTRIRLYTVGSICSFTEEGNMHQVGNLREDIIVSLDELRCSGEDDDAGV